MLLERIGLIDIGSNTIRLVIFEIDEHFTMFQVQNIKTPARLFQYLDKKKKMSQAGIDVLIKVLKSFKSVADQYQVSALMPVATAAIRQSTNRDDIIKQVRKATKIEMMLLPEEKEAFYGNYAVLHTTQFLNGVTIDIGGGSTEVTYYENKELQQYHSFPFGVVTLKQMFFDGKEHNDPKAIKKMQEFVKDQFKSIKWLSKKQVPIVAMGGSARSIANVHQRKIDYRLAGVHGYRMYKNDLQMTLDLFQSLSIPQLQNLDGLSRDRTDLIIPANVVFNTLFDEVKAPVFLFSNKGLREGIVMEFLNDKYENKAFSVYNIAAQSVSRLAASYHTLAHVAQQRVKLV
ncbi:MAG TPA: Ppx/GppA family phosphatase, partial [Trichococcus flocculiformis]|nr:Ppx/GppA family phosphatase [Trichococcus flocculiformis]